jgi:hypothetical protein
MELVGAHLKTYCPGAIKDKSHIFKTMYNWISIDWMAQHSCFHINILLDLSKLAFNLNKWNIFYKMKARLTSH